LSREKKPILEDRKRQELDSALLHGVVGRQRQALSDNAARFIGEAQPSAFILMPIPPRRPRCLWVHCEGCGMGEVVATGYTAQFVTRRQILASLLKLGWAIAPKKLCKWCDKRRKEKENEIG